MYTSSIYFLLSYIFIFSQLDRVGCHRRGGGYHDQEDFVPSGRGSSRGGHGGGSQARLIDVDVKVKQDTQDSIYEYFADAEYERFTAKSGNLIRTVLKSGKPIFTAENKKYIDRVVIFVNQDGEKKIKFLLPGEDDPDDPNLRRSSGRSHQPDRGRHGSRQSSQVEYVSVNLKLKQSTDGVDYMYYENENIHKFACREGYLIRKLHKNDQVVWRATNNDFLDRVLIKPGADGKPTLSILCPGDFDKDEPTYVPGGGRPSRGAVSAPQAGKPQLIDVNVKQRESTREISYDFNEQTECETFTARPGYLFQAVYKNDRLIEQVQNRNYYDRVVIYKDQHGDRKIKFLTPGEVDLENVQFIKLDLAFKGSNKEVIYKKDEKKRMEKFKCRPGFLIRKVVKGEKVVTECKRGENFDRAVIFYNEHNERKLNFYLPHEVDPLDPDETFLTVAERVQSDIEVYSEAEEERRHAPRPQARVAPDLGRRGRRPSFAETVPMGSMGRAPVVQDRYVDDGSGIRPVPLDLADHRSSGAYKYKKSGYIHIFVANEGYGFNRISLDGQMIWNGSKLAKRVDYSFNTFTFVHDMKLELTDRTLKRYTKHDKKDWEEGNAISTTPIEVDIKATKDNDQYRSQSHGSDRIFLPHPGWAFDRIKESASFGSPVLIWSTEEPTEYVIKIVRDGVGLGKSITKMKLFLINGLEKTFTKSGGNWTEISTNGN